MDKKPQPQPQSNRPNKPMPAKKNDIKDQYRVNERIRAKEVRLVGDNVEQGVYTIQEAIHMADEQGLDLIEISPNAVPPVWANLFLAPELVLIFGILLNFNFIIE